MTPSAPSRRGPGPWAFPALLLVLVAALFWPYLAHHRLYLFTDIGSDTVQALYPRLVHAARQLRDGGLPAWSFRHGLGQDLFGRDLGDPFNWPLMALGPDRLAAGIAWVEAAKVLAAGLLFFAFLGLLGLSPLARAVGALGFAFSGFMVVGSTWYVFSTLAVYLALILYAFERGFARGRWGLLPVAFALIGMGRPFALYTHGLFLGAYATARFLAAAAPPRRLPALWGRLAGLAVLGAAMGAVLLLPQLANMAQSPRGGGSASYTSELRAMGLFRPGTDFEYATLAARLFGNDLYGTGSGFTGWVNYLEAPLLYVGLFTLLLGPLAFPLLSRRERIAWGGLLAVFTLLLVLPGLRHAFWLYLGNYYRSLGLYWGVCLLLPAALALDRMDRGARPHLGVLGAALVVAVGGLLLLPEPVGAVPRGLPRAALAGFLLAYAALLAGVRFRGMRPGLRGAFLLLVAVEVSLLARPAVDRRPVVTPAEVARGGLYGGDFARAAALVARRDPGLYRVSMPLRTGLGEGPAYNDSLVLGFNGTPVYDNFNQTGYIRFLGLVGALDPADELSTRWVPGLVARPLLETLVGVKYRLQPVAEAPAPFVAAAYVPRARVGGVEVLENTDFLPLGLAFDRYVSRAELARIRPGVADVVMLAAVVVDRPEDAAAHGLSALSPDAPLSIQGAVAARRAEALEVTAHAPGHVAGTLTVGGPRLLFLSIPFDPGWRATVDGTETPLVQVDGGLTGLYLGAGRHAVGLDFHVPRLGAALALSVAACAAWGALFLRRRP